MSLQERFVLLHEPIQRGLPQVCPVLSRVHAQREHPHTRWDVSSCADLGADLKEGLLELFDLFPVLLHYFLLLFQRER